MYKRPGRTLLLVVAIGFAIHPMAAQHDHPVPEKLGAVDFPVSCSAAVQPEFNRAVALLHSFAYSESEKSFRKVLATDPTCVMARWGIAMTFFHQLWEPPLNADSYAKGSEELSKATDTPAKTAREAGFISALNAVYSNSSQETLRERMVAYESRMSEVAKANPNDTEAQVFYALALLATAPPTDKSHANQKRAVAILEPLYGTNPQHPGIPHYLIHAYDNAEMASLGVKAARDYSAIAPSAPHALHMPSHIFTRLGMWNDSVAANQAARQAAHEEGDVGEELHAMDYLTYAYLQLGRNDDAAAVVADLSGMNNLQGQQFKIGYAATAMPVRLAGERRDWETAARLPTSPNVPPEVMAVSIWARAVALARLGRISDASSEIARLREIERQLRAKGSNYGADQVAIQISESNAWIALANGNGALAQESMRAAAQLEDSIEKLPVTPGPIVPAREQLGDLLLELKQPQNALKEFEASLLQSPSRRNALIGASKAAELSKNREKSDFYAAEVQKLPLR
jgi:tetratricopeptide (TPR) repeat protein